MEARDLPHPSAAVVNLEEPLLTATEAAALLAVPRISVYEYARRSSDPLPSIGVGRHRRFYRSVEFPRFGGHAGLAVVSP